MVRFFIRRAAPLPRSNAPTYAILGERGDGYGRYTAPALKREVSDFTKALALAGSEVEWVDEAGVLEAGR